MTPEEYDLLMDGVADGVKQYVAPLVAQIHVLTARVAELESKPVQDGAPGPQGPPGRDGADGSVGPMGPQGEKGLDGLHGLDGAKGLDGKNGIDGRDGRDGLAGNQGEKGLDGKDGRDGTNGIDGLGFDDLSFEYDNERTFTLRFVKGDRVEEFPKKVPLVLYRGVFKDGTQYEQGDAVTWGGAMYVAKRATTQKPSESDEGARDWQLAVRRGRDGKGK